MGHQFVVYGLKIKKMEYKGYKIESDLSSPCSTGYIYYPISEGINSSKHAVSIEEAKEKIDEVTT